MVNTSPSLTRWLGEVTRVPLSRMRPAFTSAAAPERVRTQRACQSQTSRRWRMGLPASSATRVASPGAQPPFFSASIRAFSASRAAKGRSGSTGLSRRGSLRLSGREAKRSWRSWRLSGRLQIQGGRHDPDAAGGCRGAGRRGAHPDEHLRGPARPRPRDGARGAGRREGDGDRHSPAGRGGTQDARPRPARRRRRRSAPRRAGRGPAARRRDCPGFRPCADAPDGAAPADGRDARPRSSPARRGRLRWRRLRRPEHRLKPRPTASSAPDTSATSSTTASATPDRETAADRPGGQRSARQAGRKRPDRRGHEDACASE